ncbi:MAG: hypothetical protein WEB60_12865 [Terrimicrobiaceae bacterium]
MSWIFSLLVSLICGIAGLFTSGVVAAAYAEWYRMSSHEGLSGFFVMGMALLGGLAGCVVGLVIARLFGTEDASRFFKAAGVACASVVVGGGLTVSALYLLADFPPTLGGKELNLEVEIRLAKGQNIPAVGTPEDAQFVLASVVNGTQKDSRHGELTVKNARHEEGRWIVPAEVFLFTSRGQRAVEARIGDDVLGAFLVPLPANPGPDFEPWSAWMPRSSEAGLPWPEAKPSFRFRVKPVSPPPAPPTAEEASALRDREEQRVFDGIAVDASLTAWLPYTPTWQNQGRRAVAIARITERPAFARELGGLMLSGDTREAESAMWLVAGLPVPDAALVMEVQAAGRDVIERMKKFNMSTVEQDPSYEGAADVSARFSAWMTAARSLREKAGADFVPELAQMLELSRARPDSQAMEKDIRRVASFYLHAWAGVEPLPGDPPPR